MIYQMQEGYLTLEGPWQDRSVNIFVPEHLTPKGSNLVVARDTLPHKMSFEEYIGQQKREFSRGLNRFSPKSHVQDIIDQRPAHILEFAWENDGTAMNQIVSVIRDSDNVITLTATLPGAIDEDTRQALIGIMKSYRFGSPPPAAEQGE